jgi:hypothetical protein
MHSTQSQHIFLGTVFICVIKCNSFFVHNDQSELIIKCKHEPQILAAISSQLCDMPCCVLKIGHKLKFVHGVCFLWKDWLHLNKEIGQVCPILMGLL